MAKPIAVIYLPEYFHIGGMNGHDSASMELMKILNGNFGMESSDSNISYPDYWNQYYWFCFPKFNIDVPEFKVFHEKDFTEAQFYELKEMVEIGMKQIAEQAAINAQTYNNENKTQNLSGL